MPDFSNPFAGLVPRKMTPTELARAIMLNISAEYEAVHLYLAHRDATDDEDARRVLYDIALEELVHVGEFTSLLYRLDPVAAAKAEEGFAEVRQLLGTQAPGEPAGAENHPQESSSSPAGRLTVGSLLGRRPG